MVNCSTQLLYDSNVICLKYKFKISKLNNNINVCFFHYVFIDSEKIIKDQQNIINKTLGLEIIGSNIITSDDIMIPSAPFKTNSKVNNM